MNRVDETAVFNPLLDARSDGSSDSFEAFYRAECTRLFRGRFLLTRNAHEAEELMQQAFFKIWERWERASGLENVDSRLMFLVPAPGGKP
jgi:DNA-directed RNA polymerase specialized sigma24 family protein